MIETGTGPVWWCAMRMRVFPAAHRTKPDEPFAAWGRFSFVFVIVLALLMLLALALARR